MNITRTLKKFKNSEKIQEHHLLQPSITTKVIKGIEIMLAAKIHRFKKKTLKMNSIKIK